MVGERPRDGRGYRWIRLTLDLLIFSACAFMIYQLMVPAVRAANLRGDVRILAGEAEKIYAALDRYHRLNGAYPNSYLEPAFETDSFEPLRRWGYYQGYVKGRLLDDRIDAYDSPDDRGANQEYWLEMTLKSDPRIRLLVARSDDAPLGGGKWREGVFVYRNGVLEPI